MINIEDVKLKSLANLPSFISGICIKPPTLRVITEVGYENYKKYLSAISIQLDNLVSEDYIKKIPENLAVFDLIYHFFKEDELSTIYHSALLFFLRTENVYYDNGLFVNNTAINPLTYTQIIEVIKIQNCINDSSVKDTFNPGNERAKKIRDKILENRRRIQELKKSTSDNSEELTFRDLVSILSSNANGINILNVFELNMFQFNDQFDRMKILNDYEISIQSLLHGADPKKVEIKHWISKS